MANVDYNELKEMAKNLNDACGTAIKVIGIKKDVLIAEVRKAVEDSLDGIPSVVTEFYNKHFIDQLEDVACAEATKLGNTFEVLKEHAGVLGIEVNEKLSLKGLENLLFETLDNLDQADWDQLPLATQEWDADMGKKVKEMKKAAKTKPEPAVKNTSASSSKDETSSSKGETDEKVKKKKKPIGPRPDFTFTEGTNAHQIMSVFDSLWSKAKGEGLKIKDIQDACEKANVSSNNVRTRVSGVLKYAQLPEGGEQVFKHNGLFYKKGATIPEAK